MNDEIRDLESLDGAQELYEAIEEVTKEEADEPIVNADYEGYEEDDAPTAEEIDGDDANSNVHISSDVICKIAEIAATEIDGVASMYNGIVGDIAERIGERIGDRFGAKKLINKAVKLQMEGRSVVIDLYICIEYGAIMLDVASDVQENVKNNVETMTGLKVTDVNVHIEGVTFTKKADNDDEDAVIEIDED